LALNIVNEKVDNLKWEPYQHKEEMRVVSAMFK